jgi:hypothetical protein
MKMRDYNEARKYFMVPKMATVQIFGRRYIALDAVRKDVEGPIIITVTA